MRHRICFGNFLSQETIIGPGFVLNFEKYVSKSVQFLNYLAYIVFLNLHQFSVVDSIHLFEGNGIESLNIIFRMKRTVPPLMIGIIGSKQGNFNHNTVLICHGNKCFQAIEECIVPLGQIIFFRGGFPSPRNQPVFRLGIHGIVTDPKIVSAGLGIWPDKNPGIIESFLFDCTEILFEIKRGVHHRSKMFS